MTVVRTLSSVCCSRITSAVTTYSPASIIVANLREKICRHCGFPAREDGDRLGLRAHVDELHDMPRTRRGVHQRHALADLDEDRVAGRERAAGDADARVLPNDLDEHEDRIALREQLLEGELLRPAVDEQGGEGRGHGGDRAT